MRQRDIDYFNREKNIKNPIFLDRFPKIEYEKKRVLDLGCGHGAMSIDIALRDAKQVIGVDICSSSIEFANENLRTNFPELKDKVSFTCDDFTNLEDDSFDIVISKASFEHILNLNHLLVEMRKKLKLGGKIVAGFGPLYNAPWGDHNRLKHKLPWSHIIFGERYFLKKLNEVKEKKVESIHDLGLNGYSLKDYENFFNTTEGLAVIDFRTNVSNKLVMKVASLIASFPGLREYFTYNIYCTLQRVK
jgi:SAM-dependent methyltransferase